MIKVIKTIHHHVTKLYAHPVAKPALTHTGVIGFVLEFLHAVVETAHHIAPMIFVVLPLALQVNEAYMPWRDLTIGYAALALALVIYCDNAHHALSVIDSLERLNNKEKK